MKAGAMDMEAMGNNQEAGSSKAELRPRRRRHALRLAVIGQCFGMPLWHCMITGGLATLYALSAELDAGDLAVGLVNAALYVGIAALALSPAMPKRDSWWTLLAFWTLSGVAALPLLAVPEVAAGVGPRAALAVLALSCMFYAGFYAAGVAGWTPLLHGLLPDKMAQRFIGVLRMAWQFAAFLAMLAVAVIVGADGAAGHYRFAMALFLLAHFVRIIFIGLIPRRVGAAVEAAEHFSLWDMLKAPGFRPFAAYCALASFLTMLSVPSMYVYLVRRLEFTHYAVALMGAAGLLGGLATFPLWGRLAERRGVGVVYQAALFTAVVGLGLWLVPVIFQPDPASRKAGKTLFVLACVIFFALRSADAGLSLAFARHAYRLRPKRPNAPPGTLAPAAQWGGAALGVLAGGAFIALAGPDATALGFRSYQWLFLVNALCLLVPLGLAGGMEATGAEGEEGR